MLFSLFGSKRRAQLAAEAAVLTQRAEQRALQKELGERALERIQRAVAENTLHYQKYLDYGPMKVSIILENAGSYSILVVMSGTNDWHGGREDDLFAVLQFDINVHTETARAHYRKFGPVDEAPLEELDSFLEHVCKRLQLFRVGNKAA